MIIRRLSFFLLLALSALRAETPKPLAATLQPFVDDKVLAGAVTLVADKDKVLEVGTVGWADVAAKKPMTLTISRKIYAILGGILLIFLALFGAEIVAGRSQELKFAERYRGDVEAAVQLSRAQDALWRLRYGFPQFLAYAENSPERQKIVDDEPALYATIADALDKFERTGINAAEMKALNDLRTVYRQYTDARPKWFQLIKEGKPRDAVLVRLAPDGLRLRLNPADRVVHHARAVQHPHRALDLDREIDVAGRIDDVDAVLREVCVQPLP